MSPAMIKPRNFRFGKPGRDPKRPGFKKTKIRPNLVLKIRVLGFDTIEFWYHGLDQMEMRSITRDEVIEAIDDPTTRGLPTKPGRKRIRKAFPSTGRIIDVVYDEKPDRLRVITAYELK
jgi:hypothetical protein